MEPPIKPEESDCCNSGCNPCILDVYEAQVKKYRKAIHGTANNPNNCLSSTSFTVFKLVRVEKHSKDCNLYTFEYVRPQKSFNIPGKEDEVSVIYEPGQHLLLKGNYHNEMFQKAYTPIFLDNQPKKQFTVLVKHYKKGKMARFFSKLEIGHETLWRGPYGDFKINYEEINILFIAQGTGIAPFYSIICDTVNNEECYTFLRLFFCCDSENVLLREELYQLTRFWNFKYELFLPGAGPDTLQAKFNETVHHSRMGMGNIESFLRQAKGGCKVLVCGANSFCDNVTNILVQCEVQSDDIIVF